MPCSGLEKISVISKVSQNSTHWFKSARYPYRISFCMHSYGKNQLLTYRAVPSCIRPTRRAKRGRYGLLPGSSMNSERNMTGLQSTGYYQITWRYCETRKFCLPLKVEFNGFPHGVFLIKIVTIWLLDELPISTALCGVDWVFIEVKLRHKLRGIAWENQAVMETSMSCFSKIFR